MTNAPPNAAPEGDAGADDRSSSVCVTIIVSSVLIIGVLPALDATVINSTIDTLAKTFDSTLSIIQWYIPASMILLPVWLVGHRRGRTFTLVIRSSKPRVQNLLAARPALVVGVAQRRNSYCAYGATCLAATAS